MAKTMPKASKQRAAPPREHLPDPANTATIHTSGNDHKPFHSISQSSQNVRIRLRFNLSRALNVDIVVLTTDILPDNILDDDYPSDLLDVSTPLLRMVLKLVRQALGRMGTITSFINQALDERRQAMKDPKLCVITKDIEKAHLLLYGQRCIKEWCRKNGYPEDGPPKDDGADAQEDSAVEKAEDEDEIEEVGQGDEMDIDMTDEQPAPNPERAVAVNVQLNYAYRPGYGINHFPLAPPRQNNNARAVVHNPPQAHGGFRPNDIPRPDFQQGGQQVPQNNYHPALNPALEHFMRVGLEEQGRAANGQNAGRREHKLYFRSDGTVEFGII